jgi:RNA polymerase sigma factor (sigma-70 family)
MAMAGSLTTSPSDVETHLRELAPEVLGSLVRRYRDFDACDDAVQEALMAAATRWPIDGLPRNPRGWLVTVATRRLIESWRSDAARHRREEAAAALAPEPDPLPGTDDTLALLFMCCHPALTPPSQVALTLRAVGGLTTAEIARALLVPEATVGQRISRAKQAIRTSGVGFRMPDAEDHDVRLAAVLRVLYLIFNEGYAATSGPSLVRVDLSAEAIRVARQLRARLPADGEVAGLLALMLLTDARRPARTGPEGSLVPLAEQDRMLWDADAIAEGTGLIERALAETPIGPYQLQAAIAAIHDAAPSAEATDWRQISALYEWLDRLAPGPMVALNRIVALAMLDGPEAGLERLGEVESEAGSRGHRRIIAVRAHLLEMAGIRERQTHIATRRGGRSTCRSDAISRPGPSGSSEAENGHDGGGLQARRADERRPPVAGSAPRKRPRPSRMVRADGRVGRGRTAVPRDRRLAHRRARAQRVVGPEAHRGV